MKALNTCNNNKINMLRVLLNKAVLFILLIVSNTMVAFAADYDPPYPLPALTGDWRTDFVAVAMSQEGYTEAEDGSSYFGAWAGQTYRAWCSEFTAWCADQAGIPKSVIPLGKSSSTYRTFFANKGRYFYLDGGIDGANTTFMKNYKNISTIFPEDLEYGDILLMETNGDTDGGPDHTAIFLSFDGIEIEYISGNSSDSVEVSSCLPGKIHGVCKPDFSKSSGSSSSNATTASASNADRSTTSSKSSSGKKSSGGGGGGSSSSSSSVKAGAVSTSTTIPDYVKQGRWYHYNDNWVFIIDTYGDLCIDQWAAVYNSYANTESGQSSFDWFHFDDQGYMQKGWFTDRDGLQYYLNPVSDGTLGAMKTGWVWISDENGGNTYCYYFNPETGQKLSNTSIDGYQLDEAGRWIVDGIPQVK